MRKYYIIAGEASGDLHGANLIRAIRNQDAQAQIRCWGGDKMEAAGGELVKHYRNLAFMGFWEVLTHLPKILDNISFCKNDIRLFQPDVIIFVDYPGFNLRMATWAKRQGYKTAYYISPQVWAWNESRVKKIKRDIDRMIVILPFEKAFYQRWDYAVDYVGHPLTEVVKEARQSPLTTLAARPIVALLPGSREQEITKKLPIMLTAVEHFPDYQFVVAQAPGMSAAFYDHIVGDSPVLLVRDQTYNLLRQSHAALVTSGTATLESALFEVPQVVCYQGNPISYWLAKFLVKISFISLVNLIMDRPVVKELIQGELNQDNLRSELEKILDGPQRSRILDAYQELRKVLGENKASEQAAAIVVRLAFEKSE